MCPYKKGKYYRVYILWLVAIAAYPICANLAVGTANGAALRRPPDTITQQSPQAAAVINSVCDKIITGDFKAAHCLIQKARINSEALTQLDKIIDEYVALKAQREQSRNCVYRTQLKQLEELCRQHSSNDANDIAKVLASLIKTAEYANNRQRQLLLESPYVMQAVYNAKNKVAKLESKGKWLDAYTICDKLQQIYNRPDTYSSYAQQLLKKHRIADSLRDSPCEAVEERYAGIEKQMFSIAIDTLHSGYVEIIDYPQIAVGALQRCKLLAEVMGNYLDAEFETSSTKRQAWSAALNDMINQVNQRSSDFKKEEFINLYEKLLSLNNSPRAGLALPQELLITQFADGALTRLDRHTVIYWPSQVKVFKKTLSQQFSGIGIKFSKKEKIMEVVSVFPDTPAYNSGLRPGDVIEAVDGVKTINMSSVCAAERITGPEGTTVTLTINQTIKDKPRDITINREIISIPPIRGWKRTNTDKWLYMIDVDNKIGYIKITSFNFRTVRNFEKVLTQLEKEGLKGLILDIRSNPGGLLTAAVEIMDKFIEEGLILRIQPRFPTAIYLSAEKHTTHPDYPLIVLINRFSASASEIVAGVLQDPKYARATVVGERSYGKGSVQSTTGHSLNGAKLKYTTAYCHLPSGKRIESRTQDCTNRTQTWGISPDVYVGLRPDELEKLTNLQRINENRSTNENTDDSNTLKEFSSRQTINADPQLATAILVLKAKMIRSGHMLVLHEE